MLCPWPAAAPIEDTVTYNDFRGRNAEDAEAAEKEKCNGGFAPRPPRPPRLRALRALRVLTSDSAPERNAETKGMSRS
jgi:hypothetical protein